MSEGPELAEHVAETLDIGPGSEVYEVACAAGDFLISLHDNGYIVGGLDADPGLIAAAMAAMPGGQFVSGSPAELDPAQRWQVVVCRAFGSFPDTDYARGVLARMAAKATHAVAILEVPEELYDRRWMLRALAEIGVAAVQMEEMTTGGGREGAARYHVFARL